MCVCVCVIHRGHCSLGVTGPETVSSGIRTGSPGFLRILAAFSRTCSSMSSMSGFSGGSGFSGSSPSSSSLLHPPLPPPAAAFSFSAFSSKLSAGIRNLLRTSLSGFKEDYDCNNSSCIPCAEVPVFSSRISIPHVVFCIHSSSSHSLPLPPPGALTPLLWCHSQTPARPAPCRHHSFNETKHKHIVKLVWEKPYLLMKSLKGVLVNLWKSLRALSSFQTLMMLLTRALTFFCSTSRNWRVCLTIQEETKNQFKCVETTIINITGRGEWKVLPHFLFVLRYPLLGHLTQSLSFCVAPAYYELCSSSCSTTHTHTHTHSEWVWRTGGWEQEGGDGLSAHVHGWREDDGRRWGRIHLHPAGSLPGGCPFQLCRGSHAWSSEPGAEQTTVETPCHYANIQLLCIIHFQK